jgi:hypothetical protein
MALDDKNNSIEVCTFESFLSLYFIEHPELFYNLIDRILTAMEQLISHNAENTMFDRELFSVFTNLHQISPNINNLNELRKSKSIVVLFDTFCKYFTEQVMSLSLQPLPSTEWPNSAVLSTESHLTQRSFFKEKNPNDHCLNRMRPDILFSAENRGVADLDTEEDVETRNLGILSAKDTPEQLKNYFSAPHFPSRQYYKPNENSLMGQWLRSHSLPIISGASGGIGKTLSKINLLVPLSIPEFQLLGILIASSTIALGHHSFFEVIRPLSFFTGHLERKPSLLEFYEQIIPEEIKCLASYKLHMRTHSPLIKDFHFEGHSSDHFLQP